MTYSRVTWHVGEEYCMAGDQRVSKHDIVQLGKVCVNKVMDILSDINGGYVELEHARLYYPGTNEAIIRLSAIIPTSVVFDTVPTITTILKEVSKNDSIVTEIAHLNMCLL